MWRRIIGLIGLAIATVFFLLPGITTVRALFDPALAKGEITAFAWDTHRAVSPRYEKWARQWMERGTAADLPLTEIASTEWPLFGSCFYLWATESLHAQATAAGRPSPMTYAAGAVEAATALVIDPRSAAWVRKHWGEDYLTRENVFYRMLLMSAIISHHHLTGSRQHLDLLRQQVEGMVAELEASPSGLLDDYPQQCFPADVASILVAIHEADAILGLDHSAFLERAKRGFTGPRVQELGLPPYFADAPSGEPADSSRGCGNSYLLSRIPALWPSEAQRWYTAYEKHFWQSDAFASGFREFPKGTHDGYYMDVDAGPVLHNLGFSASAFGLAAARHNGRMDHAIPLTTQMIAGTWPMPDGTLLLPRLLSLAGDSPYLGEASLLYCLTRTPAPGTPITLGTLFPFSGLVWLMLALYFGGALLIAMLSGRIIRGGQSQNESPNPEPSSEPPNKEPVES